LNNASVDTISNCTKIKAQYNRPTARWHRD